MEVDFAAPCADHGGDRGITRPQPRIEIDELLLRLDGDVLGSLDEVSRQHRPLVDAIAAGDEDKAARLFAEHAEEAGELIAGVVASGDAG